MPLSKETNQIVNFLNPWIKKNWFADDEVIFQFDDTYWQRRKNIYSPVNWGSQIY